MLRTEIFEPIARRVEKRADSLKEFHRFRRCGCEGWLKIEVIAALGGKVQKIRNKDSQGCDLAVVCGEPAVSIELELKGGAGLDLPYLCEEEKRVKKRIVWLDRGVCLFLGYGSVE